MHPKPEYVVDLATRLLEAKKQVQKLEAEWDGLFGSKSQTSLPFRAAGGINGLPKRLTAYLEQSIDTDFNAAHLARTFNVKLGSTRTTLSKLVKAGKIEKRGVGLYGAIVKQQEEHSEAAV